MPGGGLVGPASACASLAFHRPESQDPRKDADKLAPFSPLWTTFLSRRANARDPEAAREVRWAFEELRVAIFAPELKTPVPVSVAKVAAALAAITR
jgi:ATP-dependent helicase HrpA